MLHTQRERRGHDFLPPGDILSQIPPLYGTENTPPEDKIIFVHYFSAGSDHYIAELEQREEDGHWIGFGWAVLAAHPLQFGPAQKDIVIAAHAASRSDAAR